MCRCFFHIPPQQQHSKLYPTPFALGALNVLDASPKCEFFEFFAALHYYNTMDRDELIAHTFNLADEDGGGTV
jgi:hypothetical protein